MFPKTLFKENSGKKHTKIRRVKQTNAVPFDQLSIGCEKRGLPWPTPLSIILLVEQGGRWSEHHAPIMHLHAFTEYSHTTYHIIACLYTNYPPQKKCHTSTSSCTNHYKSTIHGSEIWRSLFFWGLAWLASRMLLPSKGSKTQMYFPVSANSLAKAVLLRWVIWRNENWGFYCQLRRFYLHIGIKTIVWL